MWLTTVSRTASPRNSESLIVERLVAEFFRSILLRLVGECRAIEIDVVWAEAHDVVEG